MAGGATSATGTGLSPLLPVLVERHAYLLRCSSPLLLGEPVGEDDGGGGGFDEDPDEDDDAHVC